MDIFLNKLKARLQGEGLTGYEIRVTETRKTESKTVNIAEVIYGPLYARIVPVTDDHKLLNAEIFNHKMTRAKLTHVSQDMLSDALVAYAKESAKENVVDRLTVKGKEPITRTAADENELTPDEIDRLIDELRDDIANADKRGQYKEPDTDQMEEHDPASAYKKHVVSTFGKVNEPAKEPARQKRTML